MATLIKVKYSTIDRFTKRGSFKTIAGARKFAHKWVGKHPDISYSYGYAVSDSGTGKVEIDGEVDGRPVRWKDIFPTEEEIAREAFNDRCEEEEREARNPAPVPVPVEPKPVSHEDDICF
jgi:hypothetical protein